MSTVKSTQLKAIDFFCGAGGMSYGLQQSGIKILAGLDNASDCKLTYETNITGAKFIKHDISSLSAPELERRLHITRNDPNLVFAGCSPCQFWSKIRTDKTNSQQTAHLLKQFQKFIKYYRPGFVVVENVPGLFKRKEESILPNFLKFLEAQGYSWSDGIVNALEYGVPQKRMRYLLIATRLSTAITLPLPQPDKSLVVSTFLGVANGFKAIAAGHKDQSSLQHTAAGLSSNNLQRISLTPKSGGTRDSWSKNVDLQIPAYQGRDSIFKDVYGRMSWDKPAPTITTRFNSFSNGRFGHPDEDRAISLREGATLQTFPKTFVFKGANQSSIAKQIGNAVPPALAERIGNHLISISNNG